MTDINLSLDEILLQFQDWAEYSVGGYTNGNRKRLDHAQTKQAINKWVLAEITALVGEFEEVSDAAKLHMGIGSKKCGCGADYSSEAHAYYRNVVRTEILEKAKQRFEAESSAEAEQSVSHNSIAEKKSEKSAHERVGTALASKVYCVTCLQPIRGAESEVI